MGGEDGDCCVIERPASTVVVAAAAAAAAVAVAVAGAGAVAVAVVVLVVAAVEEEELPSQPSLTTAARCAHPTSLGWHWPGLHDCSSQYHAHGGHELVSVHPSFGSSLSHPGAVTPGRVPFRPSHHVCMYVCMSVCMCVCMSCVVIIHHRAALCVCTSSYRHIDADNKMKRLSGPFHSLAGAQGRASTSQSAAVVQQQPADGQLDLLLPSLPFPSLPFHRAIPPHTPIN